MWFRAVAAALAVWGISGAAMAAGYSEVWNPPEASGHAAAKPAKKKPGVGKVKVGAGSRAGVKQAAGPQHKTSRPTAGHVDKTATRGGAKKVASSGTRSGVRQAGASTGAAVASGKAKPKGATLAQVNRPHAPATHVKGAQQGKVVHAGLTHPVHPRAVNVAAKSGAAKSGAVKSAGFHPGTGTGANAPIAAANFSRGAADASSNPATASSGSLPPIIH